MSASVVRTIGELATVRAPIPGSTLCAVIDELFRADEDLTSVLFDDAETVRVLDRERFYQSLAGRLGFGWLLHADKPIATLPGAADGRAWREAEESVDVVALELMGTDADRCDVVVRWPDGTVGTVAASVVMAELSELYRAQLEHLGASERRFRALVLNSSDVVLLLDENGAVKYLSPSAVRVIGREPSERIGMNALDTVHPDDLEQMLVLFQRGLDNPGLELVAEYRLQVGSGAWRWFELRGRNLLGDPDVGAIVVNYRDIHERKTLEDQLRYQAFHDELTGLANRHSFAEQARLAIARNSRSTMSLGVMLLDLDGFKGVNDSIGHDAGDDVLRAVGCRLQELMRGGDVVARLGGDEFAVLCEAAEVTDLGVVAERIVAAFATPVVAAGRPVLSHVSVGVAVIDDTASTVDELLRRADLAMHAAKAAGKNRRLVWSSHLQQDATGYSAVAADLHRAIEGDELVLHYQPVVAVDTGALLGVEALVRWQHPDRGLIPPVAFIPVAEQSGLVVELGRWVLFAACDQARIWRERYPDSEPLVMAVNVSPIQLHEPGFPAEVADALARSGMDPATLELEVTEGAVVRDPAATAVTLHELKTLGIRLAIDDFGTGYSSLSQLRRFPFDNLKIDRSFVDRVDEHPADRAMVENMVTLGHALGMEVTAEGVEESVHLAHLVALGCDRAQGYFFARPGPPEAMTALLDALPIVDPH